MLEETADGLYISAGAFHIDPRRCPRSSRTRTAHARPGSAAICARLLRRPSDARRFDAGTIVERPHGASVRMARPASAFIRPAILARPRSASRAGRRGGVAALQARSRPTPAVQPICATFVTESRCAADLPLGSGRGHHYDILAWWDANRAEGKASVLFCYTLGKRRPACRLASVTDAGPVRGDGVDDRRLPRNRCACCRPADRTRARGSCAATDSNRCRKHGGCGAPAAFSDAFVSGTMRVRGVQRQRNVDRGFALSDHADWPDLLERSPRSAPLASSPPMAIRIRWPAICARRGSTAASSGRHGREKVKHRNYGSKEVRNWGSEEVL